MQPSFGRLPFYCGATSESVQDGPHKICGLREGVRWLSAKASSARILHEGGHSAEIVLHESRGLGSVEAIVFDGTFCPDRFAEKSGVTSRPTTRTEAQVSREAGRRERRPLEPQLRLCPFGRSAKLLSRISRKSRSPHAICGLAALVPKPRVNLMRFHGVFAPNSKHRAMVTPARRGKGTKAQSPDEPHIQTPAERRASMTGFCSCKTGIHAIHGNNLGAASETGVLHRHRYLRACGGAMRVPICIEDPLVIEKILTHLDAKRAPGEAARLPPCRAPPQAGLFD